VEKDIFAEDEKSVELGLHEIDFKATLLMLAT
jgi:hypothetical protein